MLKASEVQRQRSLSSPKRCRALVPALGNYLIVIFKETPLLSSMALAETVQQAKLVGAEFYRFTEAITVAGILFLDSKSGVGVLLVRFVVSAIEQDIAGARQRACEHCRACRSVPRGRWRRWKSKPGARPHCGMKAVSVSAAMGFTRRVDSTSSARSKKADPGAGRRFRNRHGEVIASAQHREFALENAAQRSAVGDVDGDGRDCLVRLDCGELLGSTTGHGNAVVSAVRQQPGDCGTNLAGAMTTISFMRASKGYGMAAICWHFLSIYSTNLAITSLPFKQN